MHSRATDRRSASKCQGKWPDQTLDQAFGLPEVLVAVSTSRLSCKRAGKTRKLMPVWDSSGESQLISRPPPSLTRAREELRAISRRDWRAVRGGKTVAMQSGIWNLIPNFSTLSQSR